jgi:hypothetical protein
MDIWVGGVVDPLVGESFRNARSPLVRALRDEVREQSFGTSVEFWAVTPMLVSGSLPFQETCVYRARRKEYVMKEFLSPVEFLAASMSDRIRLLGGTVRRSVGRAGAAGVKGLDTAAMLAAIDRATENAVALVGREQEDR